MRAVEARTDRGMLVIIVGTLMAVAGLALTPGGTVTPRAFLADILAFGGRRSRFVAWP